MPWSPIDAVCATCCGTRLRPLIEEQGVPGCCHICEADGTCLSFSEIAEAVYEAFEKFYEPDRPVHPDQEPLGDHPIDIVREMLGDGAPETLTESLIAYLGEQGTQANLGERFHRFDLGDRYTWSGIWQNAEFMREAWSEFKEHLLHRARFFDPVIRTFLDGLLEQFKIAVNGLEMELPSGTSIFRARIANSHAESERMENDPASELGPAPRRFRRGGRLDAPGIATFYGAFDPDTCLAELRPPVGSLAGYASFETLRPLQVLNLPKVKLDHVNILRPNAEVQVTAVAFLQEFHRIITRPTMPNDSLLSYVPTQVVAEFLAQYGEFDGVIYKSAQHGGPAGEELVGTNIALFQAEGIVDGVPAPRAVREERGWGVLDIDLPEVQPKLRYVDGSFRLVRVRSSTVTWTPAFNMEEYVLDTDREGLPE